MKKKKKKKTYLRAPNDVSRRLGLPVVGTRYPALAFALVILLWPWLACVCLSWVIVCVSWAVVRHNPYRSKNNLYNHMNVSKRMNENKNNIPWASIIPLYVLVIPR